MTEFASEPNAQMQWAPDDTWNLVKLHCEEKYLCKNDAEANDDCLFFLKSSTRLNRWMVPWSDDTQISEESWLKLMLWFGGRESELMKSQQKSIAITLRMCDI